MSNVILSKIHLNSIADAIRRKTNTTYSYSPANEMAAAINNIPTLVDGTIISKSGADLVINQSTITVPSGYYANNTQSTITQLGNIANPMFTPNTPTGGQMSIKATINYTNGWISNGVINGTGTASLNNLISGTYNITSNGTYNVAQYANVQVNATGDYSFAALYSTVWATSNNRVTSTFSGSIPNGAFTTSAWNYGPYSISFPNCTYIGDYAFCEMHNVEDARQFGKTFDFPNCLGVGKYAFSSTSIARIDLPKCTFIGSYAFQSCSCGSTAIINAPIVTEIGSHAFQGVGAVPTLYFPLCSRIGEYAFGYLSSYTTSLVLNFSQITEIPKGAFGGLQSINLQSTILNHFSNCVSIGESAFQGLTGFSMLDFPKCKYIGPGAFSVYSIQEFSSINFPEVEYIDSGAFQIGETYNTRSGYFSLSMPVLSLPKCSYFGSYAFCAASSATSGVTGAIGEIYDAAETITMGSSAFARVPIYKFNFPNVKTLIGSSGFRTCTQTTSFSLPKCETLSGASMFEYCTALTSINLPECTMIIGGGTFSYCSRLSSVSLPKLTILSDAWGIFNSTPISILTLPMLTTIYSTPTEGYYTGGAPFTGMSKVTEVHLPKLSLVQTFSSVVTYEIGYIDSNYTFSANYFKSLKYLYLPSALYLPGFNSTLSQLEFISAPLATLMQGYVARLSALKEVYAPNLSYIGAYRFSQNVQLSSITLSTNFSVVDYQVFAKCGFLNMDNFQNVTLVSYSGFQSCSSLTTAILPKCSSVAGYAFGSCSQLTFASFSPTSTVYVGSSAFIGCTALQCVSGKFSFISSAAFKNCSALTSVYLLNSQVCSLGGNYISDVFTNWSNITYYVPTSLVATYQAANRWKTVSSRFVGI